MVIRQGDQSWIVVIMGTANVYTGFADENAAFTFATQLQQGTINP
jgi:hypothetical protein